MSNVLEILPIDNVVRISERYRVNVGNHGSVELIDVMPSYRPADKTADYAIAAAARVSYAKGTKTMQDDVGLIDYLMRNYHTTPFEMAELKFKLDMPIFVARQVMRHRTACLSANNLIHIDTYRSGKYVSEHLSVDVVYAYWQNADTNSLLRQKMLRCVTNIGDDNTPMGHCYITDIWKNPPTAVYELRLLNGMSVRASKDHMILTKKGWKKLGYLSNSDCVAVDSKGTFETDIMQYTAYSSVDEIEYLGVEDTYDLSVTGAQNFVCSGVVVHNSINEMSARYSIIEDKFYHPAAADVCEQSAVNRQGRGQTLPLDAADEFLARLDEVEKHSYAEYQKALDSGVTRELARMMLPQNIYTSFIWKCDLHNIFKFLRLRMDSHAQLETRQFANAIFSIVEKIFPISAASFLNHQVNAISLSQDEIAAIKESRGLDTQNKRRQSEFSEKLKILGLK